MKVNQNLVKGTVALSAIGLLAGGVIAAQAAGTSTSKYLGWMHGRKVGLERKEFQATDQKASSTTRQARQQQIAARQTAIKTAITNNDYNAWISAVGTSSPIAAKVNSSNFSQYVQAYNLMQQANTILTNLGLNKGEVEGYGWGRGFMMGATNTPQQ